MRLCLYEDRRAAGLAPLAVARPVAELVCGAGTLLARAVGHFAPESVGLVVRPHVAAVARHRHALPVNDAGWLALGPTVLANARWLPTGPAHSAAELHAEMPCAAVCDGQLAYAVLPPELLAAVAPARIDDAADAWLAALPRFEAGGVMANTADDLVAANAALIETDFARAHTIATTGWRPFAGHLVGPADRLHLDPSARLDPLVVIDTTAGPVWVMADATVTAFSRLCGPCVVGEGATIVRGEIGPGTMIGPRCVVGGAVVGSVLHGRVHKPQFGCVRASYVGEGATLLDGSGVMAGGAASVIADHARVGPGVALAAGTRIGAFAEVATVPPAEVPVFGVIGTAERPDAVRFREAADRMADDPHGFAEADVTAYRMVELKAAGRRAWMIEADTPRLRRAG